ncbi:MAG: ATP-binding protein [Ktedonobacterales bacterium]
MATKRPPSVTTKKRTGRKTDPLCLLDPMGSGPVGLLSQTFLELAPDAIIVADPAGHMLLVNHQTEVLFGYPPSKLLGRPVEMLLPSRLSAVHEQHRADYLAAPHTRPMGTGLELFGQRQDGSEFPVEVSLGPLQLGDDVVVMSIIRDVTARKRLEAAERLAVQQRQALLQTLQMALGELPGGAYLVRGPEAALVMANHAAMEVWGATWPEGQPMADFLQTSGLRYFTETGQPLPPEELVTLQIIHGDLPALQRREVVRRPDGTRVPILLNAVAIDAALLGEEQVEQAMTASQQAPPGVIRPERAALVLVQDISSVQATEQLKDEFISVAAHELRTPLSAIQGFASMLEVQTRLGRGPDLADWQQEAIAEIGVATARMNALVNDLLDVTRIQADRLELHLAPVELVAMVRRCLARLRMTAEHHTLMLEVEALEADEPVVLEADSMRLEQVFGNLLGNAIKYSPQGGPVTLTLRADREAALAEVRIQDRGIGIPAEQQGKMFQRFARASNVHDHQISGTGLGLFVCRELVERHGGHIWFESAEGVGTTFFLTLPLAALPDDLPNDRHHEATGGRKAGTRTPRHTSSSWR